MNSADAQVINMVNAPHERRAWEKARRHHARCRKARLRGILRLTVKLELYAIAIGLLVIAMGHGAVADWLGTTGIAGCVAAGALELGKPMER